MKLRSILETTPEFGQENDPEVILRLVKNRLAVIDRLKQDLAPRRIALHNHGKLSFSPMSAPGYVPVESYYGKTYDPTHPRYFIAPGMENDPEVQELLALEKRLERIESAANVRKLRTMQTDAEKQVAINNLQAKRNPNAENDAHVPESIYLTPAKPGYKQVGPKIDNPYYELGAIDRFAGRPEDFPWWNEIPQAILPYARISAALLDRKGTPFQKMYAAKMPDGQIFFAIIGADGRVILENSTSGRKHTKNEKEVGDILLRMMTNTVRAEPFIRRDDIKKIADDIVATIRLQT